MTIKVALIRPDIAPDLQLAVEHQQQRYWRCDPANLHNPHNTHSSMEVLGAYLDLQYWVALENEALLEDSSINWTTLSE